MKVPTVRHVLSNSNPTLSFTVTSDGSARILPSLSSPRIISDPLHRITRFLCLPQQSFYVGLRSPPRVRLPLLKNHTTSVLFLVGGERREVPREMKVHGEGAGGGGLTAAQPAAKRRWKGHPVAVFALIVFSLFVSLVFLLGLHKRFPSGA
ncbi:hypothetical protein GW17_00048353 [Ensete ventricosum]|nr:hypothetical protein GW17_00048353 [Ensete ventricosum]